jgi:AmmeMemoRadiSam system protein B
MPASIRQPAVAGRFYPQDPDALREEVRSYLSPTDETVSALGCIVPHAGYIYSGHVAGAVYTRLDIPRRCIVLCPNHTDMGRALAIMSEGEWETPLGRVMIDAELAYRLTKKFPLLNEDSVAHRAEHAIEVQLPFLQVRKPDFTFVPIALGTSAFEVLEALGYALAEVVTQQNERVLLIASSDMNHYENDHLTRVKDHKAIDQVLALDPRALFDVVQREKISMCGFGPAVAMLTAVKQLGATRVDLVKYATSGDVSGDRDRVVGYAGIIVK